MTRRRRPTSAGPALSAVAIWLAGTGSAPAQPSIAHEVAVLRGLDKVTARIDVLEAPLDQEIRFGTLAIRARACYATPPTEPPESAAFLEIDEVATDGARDTAFTGWMFASSPGISALEHPVYDVWVIDCLKPVADASPIDPAVGTD